MEMYRITDIPARERANLMELCLREQRYRTNPLEVNVLGMFIFFNTEVEENVAKLADALCRGLRRISSGEVSKKQLR
jgi:hypothetical protein